MKRREGVVVPGRPDRVHPKRLEQEGSGLAMMKPRARDKTVIGDVVGFLKFPAQRGMNPIVEVEHHSGVVVPKERMQISGRRLG